DDGNPEIPTMLDALMTEKLIDEVLVHEPEKYAKTGDGDYRRMLEKEKRNIGLDAARRAKCDYFMTMDTDEFYDDAAVTRAKEKIIANGITHSFVHILNYGRHPTQLSNTRKWEYYVPFFSVVMPRTKLGAEERKEPCLCDVTRIPSHFNGAKYYCLEDIFMHHYTRVRKNLDGKYDTRKVAASFDDDWINKDDGFITVPDYFELGRIAE
ncbi:MAG: hypothetical protein FWF34_01995, partial [Alphaproteobacteria bacterium]|nr:hypothetical protein [Alphaproteobacteria bacterium]